MPGTGMGEWRYNYIILISIWCDQFNAPAALPQREKPAEHI
jgi:hypothetical protein